MFVPETICQINMAFFQKQPTLIILYSSVYFEVGP